MQISISPKKISFIKADVELVIIVNKDFKKFPAKERSLLDKAGFKGGIDEVLYLPEAGRVYAGAETGAPNSLRTAAAMALRSLAGKPVRSVKTGLAGDDIAAKAKAVAEGLLLGAYKHEQYLSKRSGQGVGRAYIAYDGAGKGKKALEAAIDEAAIIASAVNLVRDAVNTSPEDMTPLVLSRWARAIARRRRLGIKVYGEAYVKKQGMGAFYAVSKASPYPPQLIHLSYRPKKAKAKVALVGKGLTFDAGGLSLKPSEGMVSMKSDMAGAAAILGAIDAASALRLPIEVHAVVGATENVVGRHSFKPGDVVKAMNGKTIEIKNTDAEGRLVLADCLFYAQRAVKADRIIDVATLTGACVVALGEYTAGIMARNPGLAGELAAAGARCGEMAAYLPFNRYLAKGLLSRVADIANITPKRWGGAITAALFLEEFVLGANRAKWAHLDIAGPSYVEEDWGENPYGASGFGVRLLVEWLAVISAPEKVR